MSKEIIPQSIDFEIENRDSSCTQLRLPDCNYVEINPFEILENCIENNVENENIQSILVNILYSIEKIIDENNS